MKFILFISISCNMENMAYQKIVNAIEQCTYNKPDPDAPPGVWSTWLVEHGVFGEQMQTCFCVKCGEYQYLSYQMTDHYYLPAPSEPPTCNCPRITYRL